MLAVTLAGFFLIAAISAVSVIVSSVRSCMPDVRRLHAFIVTPPGETCVSWRIFDTGSQSFAAGSAISLSQPATRSPSMHGPVQLAA